MKTFILLIASCITAAAQSSIWPSTATPGTPLHIWQPVTVGIKFRSDVAGSISALRFYKGAGNNGTHIGLLYASSGTLLAQATYTNETASGWQQVSLSAPVTITANTTYIVGYNSPTGYAADEGFFGNSGVDNAPLHALRYGVDGPNGVYAVGSTPQFPNLDPGPSNYWADLVFRTSTPIGPGIVTNPVAGANISLSQSPWPGAPPALTIRWGPLAPPYTEFNYCISEQTSNCYALAGNSWGDGRSWNPGLPAPREGGTTWGPGITTTFSYLTPNIPHTVYLTVTGSPGWNGVNMNNVLLTQMSFTLTILQDLPNYTTYNVKNTQVYYPPTDPVPDDYTGGLITLNALQKRWKVTRGHLEIPRADNIDVGKVTYAKPEGADGGAYRYSYTFDNRQVYAVRIGDLDILNLRPTASTQPEGWLAATTGWGVLPNKPAVRSQQAEYSITTLYRPGLIPLHIAGKRHSVYYGPEEGLTRTELEFAADRASIFVNSHTEYVIGPAFKPDATAAQIKERVGWWVNDYGMKFLQPYLDTGRLDAVQPSNQLERDVLDCLRAVL